MFNYYRLNNSEQAVEVADNKEVKENIYKLNLYYESMEKFRQERNRIPSILEWKTIHEEFALEKMANGEGIVHEINPTIDEFIESIKDKQKSMEISINARLKMVENYYNSVDTSNIIEHHMYSFSGMEIVFKSTSKYLTLDHKSYKKFLHSELSNQVSENLRITDIIDDNLRTQFYKFFNNSLGSREQKELFDHQFLWLSPCITNKDLISINDLIKYYISSENKLYSSECYYELNDTSTFNKCYMHPFLAELNTTEAQFLILRYGLMNNKRFSFKTIKSVLKVRSYIELINIMINAFWKLKSRWPISLISCYLFKEKNWSNGHNSIYTLP